MLKIDIFEQGSWRVTEDDSNEGKEWRWVVHEWFAVEEAGTATRGTVKVSLRSTEQQVVQWDGSRRRFYRSFS